MALGDNQFGAFEQHGMCGHSVHTCWANMKRRCLNPDHPVYKDYGGRGIKVCERWMSFINFRDDMLDSWAPGLELDREENDGDYTPENCRWVVHKVNSRNKGGWRQPMTVEGRRNISKARQGKTLSDDHKANIGKGVRRHLEKVAH